MRFSELKEKSFWEKYFFLVRKVPKRTLSNTHNNRGKFYKNLRAGKH